LVAHRPAAVARLKFLGATRDGRMLRFSAKLPGAGTLAIRTTAKPRGHRSAMTLGAGMVTVKKAQTKTVTVRLSAKAIRALRGLRSVRLTTYVTWRPRGGKAITRARARCCVCAPPGDDRSPPSATTMTLTIMPKRARRPLAPR
jgi:hypothetical protein